MTPVEGTIMLACMATFVLLMVSEVEDFRWGLIPMGVMFAVAFYAIWTLP